MYDSRLLLTALVLGCLLVTGCQPASEVPSTDAAAEGGEPPPPPPPLPTETTGARDSIPPDPASPPPTVVAETAVSRPVTPPPAQDPPPPTQPPAARARTDCQAPGTGAGAQRVRVFFSCGEEIRPVDRPVASTRAVLRTSLEELLRGPTAEERAAGFTSFFGDATAGALRSVVVRDGVAHIDFADFSRAIPNASSSAGSAQVLGQLRATIFQYPSIRSARITFDGSCDAFWDWLQRGCMPLNR